MASPVTKTDIVNAAAALLGSTERVTSLDGGGNLARHASAVWDLTVRQVLADHPWNFAIRRASLNAGPAPAFGASYAYDLPPDCLRLLSCEDADGCEIDAVVEGAQLLTDSVTVNARYISQQHVDNTTAWPPHVCRVVEHALASAMAEALTGSQGIDGALQDKAERHLRRARRIDGLESQDRRLRQVNVRSGFLRMSGPAPYWRR